MNAGKQDERLNYIATYILGRTEQFIEIYARSSQVSAGELARRVAELLSLQTGGQSLGPRKDLPDLQRESAETSEGRQQHLEVADRAYSRAQSDGSSIEVAMTPLSPEEKAHAKSLRTKRRLSPEGLAAIRAASKKRIGYKYPPGTHWMQKKANRKKMLAITRRARKFFDKSHPGRKYKPGTHHMQKRAAAIKAAFKPSSNWAEKFQGGTNVSAG